MVVDNVAVVQEQEKGEEFLCIASHYECFSPYTTPLPPRASRVQARLISLKRYISY
jgi:hypothetical protein